MSSWPPPAPTGLAKTILYAASIGLGVLLFSLVLVRWVPGVTVGIVGGVLALAGTILHALADREGATHVDSLKLYGHALLIVGALWALGGFGFALTT